MAIKLFVSPLKINNIIVLKGSSQYKIEQSEDSHYLRLGRKFPSSVQHGAGERMNRWISGKRFKSL